jgi:hypothetical protein
MMAIPAATAISHVRAVAGAGGVAVPVVGGAAVSLTK